MRQIPTVGDIGIETLSTLRKRRQDEYDEVGKEALREA